MTRESIDDIINPDRMPFTERMAFQVVLIEKMIETNLAPKSKERFQAEMNWAENYALKVSEIIDTKKNEDLRNLIFDGKYEEACMLIIPMLHAAELEHAEAA